jgi:hypothetical protein
MLKKEQRMINTVLIVAKPGVTFDPRKIKGTPEEPFEEWLMNNFDLRLFNSQAAIEEFTESLDPDRYWAQLPLADWRRSQFRLRRA